MNGIALAVLFVFGSPVLPQSPPTQKAPLTVTVLEWRRVRRTDGPSQTPKNHHPPFPLPSFVVVPRPSKGARVVVRWDERTALQPLLDAKARLGEEEKAELAHASPGAKASVVQTYGGRRKELDKRIADQRQRMKDAGDQGTTTGEGVYTSRPLVRGEYLVEVRKEGYQPARQAVSLAQGTRSISISLTPVRARWPVGPPWPHPPRPGKEGFQ